VKKEHMLLSALLLLGACSAAEDATPRDITLAPGNETTTAAFNGQINDLVANAAKSYVTLAVKDPTLDSSQEVGVPRETITAASGFAIDNEGHVLTAAHVAIASGWLVTARGPNGVKYQGRVLATMPKMDMAIVKLVRYGALRPVTPAASPCLDLGAPIYSLGKPRKKGDTARLGSVVSLSFGRPVSYQGYGYSDAMVLRMQTRAGESGGPVFNADGKLIGMIVSTLSDGTGRPLDLAHAVTMPMLADFVCSKIDCAPAWRALVNQSVNNCPKSKTARKKSG